MDNIKTGGANQAYNQEAELTKNRCECGQYFWLPDPDVEEFYQGGREMYCPGCGHPAERKASKRLPEHAF